MKHHVCVCSPASDLKQNFDDTQFSIRLLLIRVIVELEPIAADLEQEVMYTLDCSPPSNRRAHLDKQPFTPMFTPMGNLVSSVNLHACFWNVGGRQKAEETSRASTGRTRKHHTGESELRFKPKPLN